MISCAASIVACAIDWSTSYGASRQSNPIESFSARNASAWRAREPAAGDPTFELVASAHDRSTAVSASATCATCPSVIAGKERQRDRAGGHVLADRELAFGRWPNRSR